MRLNIHIQKKRLKVRDMLAIEEAVEGRRPFHAVMGIVAKCMQDGNGNYLDTEAAMQILEEFDLEDAEGIVQEFNEAIKRMEKAAIPPPSGGK